MKVISMAIAAVMLSTTFAYAAAEPTVSLACSGGTVHLVDKDDFIHYVKHNDYRDTVNIDLTIAEYGALKAITNVQQLAFKTGTITMTLDDGTRASLTRFLYKDGSGYFQLSTKKGTTVVTGMNCFLS